MQTLVIGSTCVDIIIRVPSFPKPGQDVNTDGAKWSLGGTAFNVAKALQKAKSPFVLCSPVGTGVYANFVETELERAKIPLFAKIKSQENGACWCLVNAKNEHAFICAHKAEYIFEEKFYKKINFKDVDSVYFCGLEMEEKTSEAEIDFLARKKEEAKKDDRELKIFFDPSARVMKIKKTLLKKIWRLNPILHLNQKEAFDITGLDSVPKAAAALCQITKNDVIMTTGKNGSYIFERETGKGQKIPGVKANVVNTIGCGDAHLGICVARVKAGDSLADAVMAANRYAAKVAETEAASL
ncbi:MAG: carbohydrate kinase family protein [Treponema sp.]|nr:carbohydrate kinase family protein [Treponema sp.]